MTVRSVLFVAAVAWSLMSCGGSSPDGKVIVLGIDGLDPQAIDLLMSEGKLPNFARLRQDGAYGRLISQKPLLSPIIWNTIATGKTPGQHGIGHFVAMDPATGEKLPVTSNLRQGKALWNITADAARRPDVDLILQGVGGADLPPQRFDPATDPLYFTHHPNWELPDLEIVGTGLTFQVLRRGAPAPDPVIPKTELDGESDPAVPKDYLTQNLIGHFHYMLGVTFELRDWPRAEAEFAKAREAAPINDVLLYNLGLIYRRNGLLDRSVEAFEISNAINPRHIATRQQVRASDRIDETKAEIERLNRLETELDHQPGELLENVEDTE